MDDPFVPTKSFSFFSLLMWMIGALTKKIFVMSFAVTLFCLSVELLLRWQLPNIPRSLFHFSSKELQVLAQNSKEALLPRSPFIMLIGDSHAMGEGHWLIKNKFDKFSRYHTAHLLQDSTGRDVISFSHNDAGNYDGGAIFSVNGRRVLNKHGLALGDPETLVVYFYEGNDIRDNVDFFKKYYKGVYDVKQFFNDDYFDTFSDDLERKLCRGYSENMIENFASVNSVVRFFEQVMKYKEERMLAEFAIKERKFPYKNMFPIVNKKVSKEDIVTLNEEEIIVGMRLFERALPRISKGWNARQQIVVYIPATLTSYFKGREMLSKERLRMNKEMVAQAKEAAEKHGFYFVNSTTAIRKISEVEPAHGPTDWSHFNEIGYRVLSDLILQAMKEAPMRR